uniref:BTB domain-containing protein n=2 Tax=Ascaris lumbricoides TaxID=6252 RepID=A0A0M3HEY2_ASCLU
MVGAPPTPDHDPELGPAGEGDGGTASREDVPTDDPIPAKGLIEGKESDVRPAVACRCAEPEEQLMKSDVRPHAVVRLADPKQHTTNSGVKPVASDRSADLEEHSKEKDIEQKDVDLEGDSRFRAFRKAFYGYFRWAVSSFDREPVKRVRQDCPKVFYAYADYLIATGSSKALGPNQSRIGRLNGLVYAAAIYVYNANHEAS